MKIIRLGLALALPILLACYGCSPAPEQSTGKTGFMKVCPGFIESGKPPLVYGAECGELAVKENPADPNSADITLSILRLPAISPVASADPLFLIQGGPGGSSIEMASQLHWFFNDVRKNRDLVFVDQRGTGKSNPLSCDQLSAEDQLLPEQEQTEKYLELLNQCAEKYKNNAGFYTTPYAAQDLDVVRSALGYKKVNLWGGSYGTRVALEFARRYPQQTRSMVLDGVAPVAIALPKHFSRDAFSALEAVNNECAEQIVCVREFGDLIQKAKAVLQRLQALSEPLVISYEHPRNQQIEQLLLTPRNFSSLLFLSLYSRDLTVLLPRAISHAEKEDYRLLAALSALANDQVQYMNIKEGMRFSVICNEDWPQLSTDEIEQSQPFLGLHFVKDTQAVCEFWPKAELPDDFWQPIKSDVPALLLSGKRDPVTPELWAKKAAEHLLNASLLTANGGNHSISIEGCIPQIIAQFIERGSMEFINTECVSYIKPLPFVLGANEKKSASSSSAGGVSP